MKAHRFQFLRLFFLDLLLLPFIWNLLRILFTSLLGLLNLCFLLSESDFESKFPYFFDFLKSPDRWPDLVRFLLPLSFSSNLLDFLNFEVLFSSRLPDFFDSSNLFVLLNWVFLLSLNLLFVDSPSLLYDFRYFLLPRSSVLRPLLDFSLPSPDSVLRFRLKPYSRLDWSLFWLNTPEMIQKMRTDYLMLKTDMSGSNDTDWKTIVLVSSGTEHPPPTKMG